MLTIAAAAARLAATTTLDDLARLVAPLGFASEPLPLDDDARTALALSTDTDARVTTGPGTLRALLVALPTGTSLRTTLQSLAARLATRAPHALWLLAAIERDGTRLTLATITIGSRTPRLATLLADRRHVVATDAESLRALYASPANRSDDDTTAHSAWSDALGREALTRRFYRALERHVGTLATTATGPGTDAERAELALLHTSRLLFLAFLEAKGWLDGDHAFLAHAFDHCMATGGNAHARLLRPLFFGTLNTPVRSRAPAARALGRIPFLNGGLFAPTPLERRLRPLHFPDPALGALLGEVLGRYRFTAHEESDALAEAAVDPEMLGRAFECLMAARARRETGAFYTPQSLVARVGDAALAEALAQDGVDAETAARALAGDADAAREPALARRLATLTVLDPACGSGAFLVHALERLAALDALAGDARDTTTRRRERLTRSIFGVDCNPTAVWLCELRLWLSVVVECEESDPLRVPPLPNLDRNVRVGDALAGGTFAHSARRASGTRIARLRERYAHATGPRKTALARTLDQVERTHAIARTDLLLEAAVDARRETLLALRARDLFGERRRPDAADRARIDALRNRVTQIRRERRRLADGGALPFRFAVHFADAAIRDGFDVVVGNPPWVRLHRIPPDARAALRHEFDAFRHATWTAGADRAGMGRGMASQVDLAALFAERSLALLRPGGTLALLLPAKLWRTLAGGGVRRLLTERATLRAIEDWSEAPAEFDAAVYPSLVVATARDRKRAIAPDDASVHVAVHRSAARRALAWCVPADRLPLDDTPGSPWLLLPTAVRAGFERLRRAGLPLADGSVGRPQLGVKSGCNEAFVVTADGAARGLANVAAADGRQGRIEAALLRPLVAGHALTPWRADAARTHLVWTHGDDLEPLERLPANAARWLAPWRRRLERRADARGRRHWWQLFRVDAADSSRPRVVWCDVGRTPRAAVLPAGDPTVPLNSCYVLRCATEDDAHAIATLLNGPLAAAWLAALAEPARGGYHRYLAWTVGLLPIPHDWPRARALLAPLGSRASRGDFPSSHDLLDASFDAYGISHHSVAPLLAWFGGVTPQERCGAARVSGMDSTG